MVFSFWKRGENRTSSETRTEDRAQAADSEAHYVGDGCYADYSFLSEQDLDGVDAESLALIARSKQLSASREL